MKITQRQLRQLIREELARNMNEGFYQNALVAALGGRARRDREDREKGDRQPSYSRRPVKYDVEALPNSYWDAPSYSDDDPIKYKKRREKWSQFGWLGPYANMQVQFGSQYQPLRPLLDVIPERAFMFQNLEELTQALMKSYDEQGQPLDPDVAQDIARRWFFKDKHPLASSRDPLEDELDF